MPSRALIDRERGTVICASCAVAATPLRRMKGLLGRRRLETDEGLLMRPAPAIHTWFLRFPVDVAFLDDSLTVLRTVEALRPWRTAGCYGARAALELPAGAIAASGIQPGDRLALVDGAEYQRDQPEAALNGSNGVRLVPDIRSARVLIAGQDRRFLRVARPMLERNGCIVDATERTSDVLELVRRRGADVVILDGTNSLTAAARTTAALEALPEPVGVVIVYEGGDVGPLQSLRLVPKWGAFPAIVGEVERAFRQSQELAEVRRGA